jgi:hypothetical protein
MDTLKIISPKYYGNSYKNVEDILFFAGRVFFGRPYIYNFQMPEKTLCEFKT